MTFSTDPTFHFNLLRSENPSTRFNSDRHLDLRSILPKNLSPFYFHLLTTLAFDISFIPKISLKNNFQINISIKIPTSLLPQNSGVNLFIKKIRGRADRRRIERGSGTLGNRLIKRRGSGVPLEAA